MDIPLNAEPILHYGSLIITNTLIASWVVMALLIGASLIVTKRLRSTPGPLQNGAEFMIEALYNLVESVAGSRARTFFPIVATLFLFILASNWFGLIPGLNAIGWFEHTSREHSTFIPLFRSAASDLNTTLGLALMTVVLTQYFGLRFRGIYGYIQHYFHNPLKGGAAWILIGLIIGAFVGLLELVLEFVKVVSLSFRLFGNIYAGEVVVTTISGLFRYITPIPFLLLETVVGAVQATVFALLTLVFFSIMSQPVEDTD